MTINELFDIEDDVFPVLCYILSTTANISLSILQKTTTFLPHHDMMDSRNTYFGHILTSNLY